ncbi:hypothetical protein ACIA5G_24210 [Amycolatopsis sp. NPDC051758]|uniref:hypothetical protein n=1 Tax=Amycolatopsis sp. NPDC051758 TaxID=3363935 RepID=UPI00379452EE
MGIAQTGASADPGPAGVHVLVPHGRKTTSTRFVVIGRTTESVAEADAWEIWKRSGLPPAAWNVKVFDRDGTYVTKPDAWCDEVAFAWEIDSVTYHGEGDHFLKTLTRNARHAAAGIGFLQTPPSRLRTEPEAVLKELRAAYTAAAARPRPPGVTTFGG